MVRTMVGLLRRRATALVVGFFALMLTASSANAETLLMPKRDYLAGTPEVVWGITTQANGTNFVLDFGDGSQTSGNVADRSYIAFQHTYALANTYTVELCVGPGAVIPGCAGAGLESATVEVQVFNGGVLSPVELRNLRVNRAIEDGLRYLWTSQSSRTSFDTNIETAWGNFTGAFTAISVLAFENHGYKLPNNNSTPTGIYEKYAVRRGFNFLLARLTTYTLAVTPQGNDPCVGVAVNPCGGLGLNVNGDSGYENGLALAAFAASGAPNRQNLEVNTANVDDQTFGEILQRLVNASAWGAIDNASGRGGWSYTFNRNSQSDGSTVGWEILGLLDAQAAGANVPQWVRDEWANFAYGFHKNNDGSFDYQSDNNPASNNSVNVAKTGVGIQGAFFAGAPANDAHVTNAKQWITDRWNTLGFIAGSSFICGNSTYNKGCAYGMYNVFKGLKLYDVTTLPGIAVAAGPGYGADDWYADYVNWLLDNQTNPQTLNGGAWAGAGQLNLYFSSQTANDPAEAAIALLILSPTALIAPDPDTFSSVGLKQGNPLDILPVDNPVGTQHTVVAKAESTGGGAIPGVTISFLVSGRNAGESGSGTTGADGTVSFSWTDTGDPNSDGVDTVQAFIGQVGSNVQSNVLTKNWKTAVAVRCDADDDGDIDASDIAIIRAANRKPVSGPNDPRDGNGDGLINVADVRYCQLRIGSI